MQISLPRTFSIAGIRLLAYILWLVDQATSLKPKYILRTCTSIFLLAVYGSLGYFLGFDLRTGYLQRVGDGILSTTQVQFPELAQDNSVLGASSSRAAPKKVKEISTPAISAKAALVVDKNSNTVLFDHNKDAHLPPASTTKLMTALVALDLYKLEDILMVPETCTSVDSTKAWLWKDAGYKVKDLLKSMLVASAGDVACVLASGKTDESAFVSLMNRKAVSLKMTDTHFTNPIGLDGVDGSHYSTPSDLYRLTKAALDEDLLRDFVRTKELDLRSTTNKEFDAHLLNTNKLLWDIPGSIGVKTGTTVGAGEVLIYEYKKDNADLVIIVMGSVDRFADTRALLNWALASYTY